MVNDECQNCYKAIRVNYFEIVASFLSLCDDCKQAKSIAWAKVCAGK